MNIREIIRNTPFLMSAEVFPPKRSGELENIIRTLRRLKEQVHPDYISVTYGANGKGATTTNDAASVAIDAFDIETVAHMTAVNMTKERLDELLTSLSHKGVHSILALRGDVRDDSRFYDFHHANELAAYIHRTHPEFLLMGACYLEGHPESRNLEEDLDVVALKMESGIEHFVTQMFFDNRYYYEFMDLAARRGMHLSLEAGIMPITNVKQLGRSVSLSGATLPPRFVQLTQQYEDDMFDAGCAYAIEQIEDLRRNGAQGVHLYTMNNVRTAATIFAALRQ